MSVKKTIHMSADTTGKHVFVASKDADGEFRVYVGREVMGRTATTMFIRRPSQSPKDRWPYLATCDIGTIESETEDEIVLKEGSVIVANGWRETTPPEPQATLFDTTTVGEGSQTFLVDLD